jgi:aspartyl-tRNA(Asn)/glutamyl-tRNA(Gln) amidotransferase subunit C
MALTRTQIESVARLARLSLSPEESERFGAQLEEILGYVERLGELNLEGVEPTAHAVEIVNRVRPDEPAPGLEPAALEAMAPEFRAGSVRVPRILEE